MATLTKLPLQIPFKRNGETWYTYLRRYGIDATETATMTKEEAERLAHESFEQLLDDLGVDATSRRAYYTTLKHDTSRNTDGTICHHWSIWATNVDVADEMLRSLGIPPRSKL